MSSAAIGRDTEGLRVLVVGVNSPVASRAYSLLSEAGIEVLSAGDHTRALDICRWTRSPINVLLIFDDLADERVFNDLQAAVAGLQPDARCIRVTAGEASDRQRLLERVRRAAAR